jgi:formate dehydrogenase assembly factor FdhD
VDSGVVKDAAKKGIQKIVSKSGFTQPAEKLAQKKGIKLTSGGRTKR